MIFQIIRCIIMAIVKFSQHGIYFEGSKKKQHNCMCHPYFNAWQSLTLTLSACFFTYFSDKGFSKKVSLDVIECYFCNTKKSGGGGVTYVQPGPKDGQAVVYFEDWKGMCPNKLIWIMTILLNNLYQTIEKLTSLRKQTQLY